MGKPKKSGSNAAITKKPFVREAIREFKTILSKDGRTWVFKDITTWLVPVGYLDKIRHSRDSEISQLAFAEMEKNSGDLE